MIKYEKPRVARFAVEWIGGVETLVIRARRNWFSLIFLGPWRFFWTIGGVAAATMLATTHEPFLAIWLIGWAFGWIFAAGTIGWQLAGQERMAVSGGDLHHTVALPGYRKTRVYRGAEVRDLSANPSFLGRLSVSYPPLFNIPMGGAKFRHGSRMIYLAQGMDEAEGLEIATWLDRRLPAATAIR